ncbi:MAG TPA: thioredoxin domain-containing protein [Pseudomonadales bacterium]
MSSKKAEQRRIKEEKQAATERRDKMTGWLLKGGAVVLLLAAAVVFFEGLFLAPKSPPPGEIAAADHVRGNTDAAHTITVYADFQCPACATETSLITRAWPQVRERAKLVFRHYPLDTHAHSFLAARYAEAAAYQDGFWPMHDMLFANQQLWAGVDDPTVLFDGYASQLGLDVMQLKQDLERPEVREKVVADQRGGTSAGVRSTPTLFIDGRMVLRNPGTVGEFVKLVDDAARD